MGRVSTSEPSGSKMSTAGSDRHSTTTLPDDKTVTSEMPAKETRSDVVQGRSTRYRRGPRATKCSRRFMAAALFGRTAQVPTRRVLIRPPDPQRGGLVVSAAHDLEGGGQAVGREPVRHGDRAQVEEVGEPRVMGRRLRLIHLVKRDGGRHGCGGEERIDPRESGRKRGLEALTLVKRFEVGAGRDVPTGSDAGPHVLVEGRGRIVDELMKKGVALRRHDPQVEGSHVGEAAGQRNGHDLGSE